MKRYRPPLAIFADETAQVNAFHSYQRGWTDGARATAQSEKDTSPWYELGYQHGYVARKAMNAEVSELVGYHPSPLRTEG